MTNQKPPHESALQDDCTLINPEADASELYDGASLRLENALSVLLLMSEVDDDAPSAAYCAWSQVHEAKRLMHTMWEKLVEEKKASALRGVDVEN